jgi:hypothetical protein
VFKVMGGDGLGVVGFPRDTAHGALDKAVELMGQGLPNVRIVAPDGREYQPSDFIDAFLKKQDDDADRT